MSRIDSLVRNLAAAFAMFALIATSVSPTLAADCPAASVVRNAGVAFMGAARQGSANAFASALARHTDVKAISVFALGQYRNGLPSDRQREYVKNTHSYMAQFLLDNATPFRSSRELIIETCNGNFVETSLDGQSRMLWRLSGGRIRDVRVGGVWLAIQLRSKFTGIIRRNHGDVDALLAFLRR